MIRDDIGISMYGIREISQGKLGELINSANSDGIAFIGKYNQPIAFVMPFTPEGIKNMYEKIGKMLEAGNKDDDDFLKYKMAMLEFMEKIK